MFGNEITVTFTRAQLQLIDYDLLLTLFGEDFVQKLYAEKPRDLPDIGTEQHVIEDDPVEVDLGG